MTLSAAFVPVSLANDVALRAAKSSLHTSPTVVQVASLGRDLTFTSSALLAEPPSASFEPILPDPSALIGMGSVIVLCVIAAVVWSEQVVPVSRTKLAISKRRGAVKEYLDELEEEEESRPIEQWLFADWLRSRAGSNDKKEPALPILKNAKWNSGDNPVLVTSALLMVGVLVAAVTERITV
jgi:hypothetical protein